MSTTNKYNFKHITVLCIFLRVMCNIIKLHIQGVTLMMRQLTHSSTKSEPLKKN